MNNRILFLLVSCLYLIGCSATGRVESTATQPELVSMTTLPTLQSLSSTDGLKLNVLFQIRTDGTVTDVKMLGSGGNSEWDRAAVDSMKQWRFEALPHDSSPTNRWIRSTIIVQVQEPTVLNIGEIHAKSQQEADSLYALLDSGVDFELLSQQIRPGTSIPLGRFVGPVEIAIYPQHVRQELRKLAFNSFTHPIRVGVDFIIYKRFRPDGPRGFQQ